MASKPIFSKPARSYTNSAEYIKQMEELTKKNKGGFSAFAEDTGSSIPYLLPGRRVASALPTQSVQKAQEPLPEEQDYAVEEIKPEIPQNGEMTALQFIEQLNQTIPVEQSVPTQQDMEEVYQATGQTYSVAPPDSDGLVKQNDGTSVPVGSSTSMYVNTDTGMLIDPDGNSYDPQQYGGLQNLIQGIFGQDRVITQEYGAVNPIEPTPGNVNWGTDIRTRDLQDKSYKIPVNAQVIDVKYATDGNPYGNSVLLLLPTGERLRFSHMSDMTNFAMPGTIIPAHAVFGYAGDTGNTTGEHLDLEFYNAQGKLDDPNNFSGYTNPQGLLESKIGQVAQNPDDIRHALGATTQQTSPIQENIERNYPGQSAKLQPTQQLQQNPLEMLNQRAGELGLQVKQNAPQLAISAIPGASNLQQATQTAEKIGTENKLPGFGVGELGRLDVAGAGKELSNTIEKADLTPRIDTGISELLRGDLAGAKQQFTNTADRIGNRLEKIPGQITDSIIPQAYADDNQPRPETLGQNLQYMGDKLGEYAGIKAGEGIDKLKKGFSGLFSKGNSLFNRPASADIAGSRAVGEVSGQTGNVLGASSAKPDNQGYDPGDPFQKFQKGGGAAQFANYMTPVDTGGALTLDMFSPEFFQDKGNIQSVFGDTPHLMTGAMSKFQAYEDQKRAEEQARAEDMKQKPGELTEEWMKRTGQQSTIDQIRKQGGTVDQQPSQSDFTYNEIKDYKNVTPQETATAVNNIFRNRPSVQQSKGLREYEVPVAQSSARLNTQAQQKAQQPSLFQKAASAISNIFKRKFN